MSNLFVSTLRPIQGFFVNIQKKLAVLSTENNKGQSGQGALIVEGGANIKKNLLVEGDLNVLGSYSAGMLSNIINWAASYYYLAGTVVRKNTTLYICTTTHTSTNFFTDWWTSGYWSAVTSPPGTIAMWHNSIMPVGYLQCNGATITEETYPELYSILGSGTLPDLRGASPAGVGTGSATYYAAPETIALGEKLDSQIEDHVHHRNAGETNESFLSALSGGTVDVTNGAGLIQTEVNTGGIHGTVNASTRGKMVGVYFIIKY